MHKTYISLSFVLVTLLVACGVGSDGKTNLRPPPPAVRPEVQRPQPSEQADNQSEVNPRFWYEYYDMNEIVIRVSPSALASAREAGPRAEATRATPRPTRQAYSRRIQNLQQVREHLLRENATLTAKLASQAKQPTPEELGTLSAQLGHLSAKQRLVMTRTRAIEVEHQALLTMLAQTTAEPDLRAGN